MDSGMHVEQEFEVHRVDEHDPGARQGGLAQAVAGNRLVLARVGADQQRGIDAFQRLQRQPQRRAQRRLRLVGEVRLAQAVIDVVDPDAAGNGLQQRHLFQRGRGRHQHADLVGTVPVDQGTHAVDRGLQRGFPVDRLPFAVDLDHRRGARGPRCRVLRS